MKSEYSFEHFQKRKRNIKEKHKRTKRRLFMLFATTFSTVLMVFLFIANLITPDIDIPALNNNYNKMTDIRSSDFKKRIDSRLQQIKKSDDAPTRIVEKQNSTVEHPSKKTTLTPEEETVTSFFTNAEKVDEQTIKLDLSDDTTAQAPIPAQPAENMESPQGLFNKKREVADNPKTQAQTIPQERPAPPTPYAPAPKKIHSYKVLVGEFNSPSQAKDLSETISKNSNSMVKPFIKNHKGKYTVQVGSYQDHNKANSIADNFKLQEYPVQIISD